MACAAQSSLLPLAVGVELGPERRDAGVEGGLVVPGGCHGPQCSVAFRVMRIALLSALTVSLD
jgi:hypothetical protein